MIVLGITTCDTVRKAVAAIRAAGKAVTLRDVRAAPLSEDERNRLVAAFGPAIINQSSATWRGMDAADRALPMSDILARHPTVMKRPVIDMNGALHLGWGADVQAAVLR